jgi:hypothetical protein
MRRRRIPWLKIKTRTRTRRRKKIRRKTSREAIGTIFNITLKRLHGIWDCLGAS